ncbi:MAG: hypothetical protein QXE51_04895 [Nitrososphaeria archaeon]
MKFSEIFEPTSTFPVPELVGYTNNTTSWFLVLGIQLKALPGITGYGEFENRMGILYDPNGNYVDCFYDIFVEIQTWNSSMTVWNGASMESEPITIYTSTPFVFAKKSMLIPPNFKFQNFRIAYGFWLSYEEVEEYILKITKENLVNNVQIDEKKVMIK